MEKFPQSNNDIKQEIFDASVESDPTKSSLLSENLNLEKVSSFSKSYPTPTTINVLKDKESGETFYGKEDAETKEDVRGWDYEYFVAMLSKGILHTSDVVEKDGKFYSREINLKNIEDKSSKEEIASEIFLLDYLFGDTDHSVGTKTTNMRIEDDKFVHFDYGLAFHNYSPNGQRERYGHLPEGFDVKNKIDGIASGNFATDLKNKFADYFDPSSPSANYYKFLDKEKLGSEILSKSESFLSNLNSEGFFDSVIKRSGVDLFGPTFKFLKGSSFEERKEELLAIFKERLIALQQTLGVES